MIMNRKMAFGLFQIPDVCYALDGNRWRVCSLEWVNLTGTLC